MIVGLLIVGAAFAVVGGLVWAQSPRRLMRRTLREIRALPERVRDKEPA